MLQDNPLVSDIQNLEHLLVLSGYVTVGALIFHLLSFILMATAVVLIYLRTRRPGRVMMLGGMLFYLIFGGIIFAIEFIGMENIGMAWASYVLFVPLLIGLSLLIIGVGFLRFALSFRDG